MHQRDAVATLGLVHEVGGNEDGDPVAASEVNDQLPETVPRHRINAGSRLVENQEVRPVDHRHRQRQALAHAQRHGVGQGVHDRTELEALRQLGDAGGDLGIGQMEQLGVQFQVLPHGQLGIKGEGLRHVADAPAGGQIAGVQDLAEQPRLAFARRQEAGEHFHGGRFAATVGAEKAEDLAPLDPQADMIDGGEIGEAHGEIVGLDGDFRRAGGHAGRNHHVPVALALFLRQQPDEGRFQGVGAGAGAQFGRGVGGEDPARIHRHQPVEAPRLVHVGRRDQHAHAGTARAEASDEFPELSARQGIDAGGRFVQHQEVGVVDQRAAQPQLLLHAARELPRWTIAEGRETGAFQEFRNPRVAFGLILAEQTSEEIHILEHRQGGIEVLAQPLRHVGDARANGAAMGGVGDVAAQHLDAALLHCPGSGEE